MQDFEQLDYYALLGVARTASLEEIKRSYRQQIARFHPDRYATAPEAERLYASQRAQRINEAYRVLSDANARSAYNRNQALPGVQQRPPMRGATPTPQQRDHQGELYEEGRAHLEAGRYLQAIANFRQLQQINPFYRDSAALLAKAEAARNNRTAPPPAAPPRPAASSRRTRRGLLLGGLGSLALVGLISAGLWLNRDAFAPASSSAALPATPAAAAPTAVPTSAAPTPNLAPSPAPTLPNPTAVASVPTAAAPNPTVALPIPTIAPTSPALVSAAEPGTLLFADDFRTEQQTWAVVQGATWSVGYTDEGYRISVEPGAGHIWSFNTTPGGADASIGVDVRVRNGSAGLMLRFVDRSNYLAFFVDPAAGTYQLEQRSAGRALVLAEGPVESLKPGANESNRLVAQLRGRQISLFVNGAPVTDVVVNGNVASARYGMIAVAREANTVALFNSLEVRTLE